MTIRVCVAGATGWTGSSVTRTIVASSEFQLVGAIVRQRVGQDIGEVLGLPKAGITIVQTLEELLPTPMDVLIDYTNPASVKVRTLKALDHGMRVVIGTSGLTAADHAEIEAKAQERQLGVIAVGNFSITAALAKHFVLMAAKYLPSWEIIDYASASKIDAPSGTEQKLAEELGQQATNQLGLPLEQTHGSKWHEGRVLLGRKCIRCACRATASPTTDSHHGYQIYPNLLASIELTAPNQAWVGDITYIHLPSCFVYLASLLDAYSRRCVGWNLSRHIDTELALGALDMARTPRHIQPGLTHHSDRGVQYTSTAYVERLQSVQAQISMEALGNPSDNAKAESFFKTLKREEVYLKEYQTLAEEEANIAQFIEDVYNTKRLHSSLGYVPPVEFEEAHFQNSRV